MAPNLEGDQDADCRVQESAPLAADPPNNNVSSGDKEKALLEASSGQGGPVQEERDVWGGKLDFFMSALSFAVGMGNMWRFPYLCYRNGGGAFLIPYIIMMVFAGFPMMFLEFCFGQYGRDGIVSIWKACPLFEGIGWSMFLVSTITSVYYNMLNGWCIFYVAASFAKDVPWRDCQNYWNTPDCAESSVIMAQNNCTEYNGTWYNRTCFTPLTSAPSLLEEVRLLANATPQAALKSPSDEYFHERMLGISPDLSGLGHVQWHLALCLLGVYVIVIICLSKGIKTSGKATYVTALFPYVVLIILLVRGLTLEGSVDGVIFYLKPQWEKLLSFGVWQDAAVQVFFSLSACWGGLITLASYNKFNNNALRDAIAVSTGDCLTSIFGGVVVFSFIGYMSHIMNMDIEKVATQGAGLAFIVYPEAVTTLPVSPLWSVLFMLMLANVGIGTQFTLVTTTHTTLVDAFPKLLKEGRRPLYLLIAVCMTLFLLGLFIATRSGIYVLQLMDNYSATYSLLSLGIILCLVLSWVYGYKRFFKDIEQMLGAPPSKFWIACWGVITPLILAVILVSTLVSAKRTSYGDFTLPIWCDVVGWLIVAVELGIIPFIACYKLATVRPDLALRQRLKFLTTPTDDWGPPPEVLMTEMKTIGGATDGAGGKLLNGNEAGPV